MLDAKIFVQRDAAFTKCPDCKKSGFLRKSRSRSIFESIVKKITFFKVYRCRQCGWRGYRSTLVFSFESFKTLVIYIAIALVCAFAVKFIINRFL